MADAIKEAVKDIKFYLDRINELTERNKELEAALRKIADTHIPDQPAATYGDGEYWARTQHSELRRVARAALGEKKDDASA
jgi:hypothetical protein